MDTNDNALMEQVAAGQIGQLAILFERHHRALFRYFVSMHRDRQMAEDLVQDVFFRMLRYRGTYNAAQPFTAWMYQIARNAGVDQSRKRREVVDIAEAAVSGAGIAILPCSLGDVEPKLVRLTADVVARHTMWLVYRRELAISNEVRAVIRFLTQLLKEQKSLLSGERAR